MDTRMRPTESPCRKCCNCLVPVRCIIDQHEVEIIPASARSCMSNDYSVRGGSSFDSTSRTAYGSGSYRQYQHQQLSERAAGVDSSRGVSLFYPPNQGPTSVRGAPEIASYRSAGASDLFNGGSQQSSWDTKAPRVPLINLRKIQHHCATVPASPVDDSRAAEWQSQKPHPVTVCHMAGTCHAVKKLQDEDATLLAGMTTSEVSSALQQEFECLSSESTTFNSAYEPRGPQDRGTSSLHSSNEGCGSYGEERVGERASVIDIQCLRNGANESQLRFSPGYLLSSQLEVDQHHDGSAEDRTVSPVARESAEYDVYYAADGFSSFEMDISYAYRKSWRSRTPRTLDSVSTSRRTEACGVQLRALEGEPQDSGSALEPNTTQGQSGSGWRVRQPERQRTASSFFHFVKQDPSVGLTSDIATSPSTLAYSSSASQQGGESADTSELAERFGFTLAGSPNGVLSIASHLSNRLQHSYSWLY
ncbi:hypothetical protein Esti_000630 [Eimeria stiedai]